MRFLRIIFAVVALPLIASPSSPAPASTADATKQYLESEAAQKFAGTLNKFAINKMFPRFAGEGKNCVFSPVSIWSIGALAANGASGDDAAKLSKFLGYAAAHQNNVNWYSRALYETYKLPNAMLMGASAWVSSNRKVHPEFETASRQFFNAPTEILDFSAKESVETVNGWAAKATNGRISHILDELPNVNGMGGLVLVTSAYFKGTWDDPFDPKDTKEKTFHGLSGDKPAMLMHEETRDSYYEDNTVQALNLGYKQGAIVMTIVLPRKGTTFKPWIAKLTYASVQKIFESMGPGVGMVEIPRFTASTNEDISNDFPDSTLDLALDKPLPIQQTVHIANIVVDEKGTEAAAITVMARACSPPPPAKPFTFIADRPFAYFIRDNASKLILFAGTYTQP